MTGRNAQVSRIYSILNLLEGTPQGLSVSEITERVNERGHGASKRTVYRDLDALAAAGFPLFPRGEPGGGGGADAPGTRWVLERTAKIDKYLVLSPRELVGLYLARSVLSPLRDTPFFDDLERMFKKIEEKLGTKANEHLKDLSSEIHFEPGPRWGLGISPDLLDTVRAVCSEQQMLSCKYTSVKDDHPSERTLGPHYLYFSKGALYLVAEDMKDHQVKTFALARMSDAQMLDAVYEGNKSDPEEHFQNAFGICRTNEDPEEVVLLFSKTVAPFVKERTWHHSQRIVARTGGAIEMRLQVNITLELVNWILSFGPEVIVQAPSHLQGQIISAAEAVVANYPTLTKARTRALKKAS